MAGLKNKDTNEEITRFVSLNEKQDVIRTIHKTLDGRQYIQRIGKPTISYELSLYVSEQGKQLIMQAEDTGALLEFTIKKGVFCGRIIDLKDFEKLPAGYYKTTATLAEEAVD